MQQRLPDWVNPVSLVERGAHLQGRLAAERFARLREFLADTSGEVQVDLQFGTFEAGVKGVVGEIDVDLRLCCQRCLGALPLTEKLEIHLGLIESDGLVDRLPEGFEPLLLTEDRLNLIEAIEDEILLALPDFPRHESTECQPVMESASDETASESRTEGENNPFAVLSKLKKQ